MDALKKAIIHSEREKLITFDLYAIYTRRRKFSTNHSKRENLMIFHRASEKIFSYEIIFEHVSFLILGSERRRRKKLSKNSIKVFFIKTILQKTTKYQFIESRRHITNYFSSQNKKNCMQIAKTSG